MKKKDLQVVSAPHRGGAETMIMNVLRETNHDEIQYDFISHIPNKSDYDDEIASYGGSVIHIKSLGTTGIIKYIRELIDVNKKYGPYDAVHCHTNLQAAVVMTAAKLCHIKIRISHSHNTNWGLENSLRNKLIVKAAIFLIKLFATEYLACGDEAGISMYGKECFDSHKVVVIHNGIDLDKFAETGSYTKIRTLKRLELGIDNNCFVIGHIGRYHDQKNHEFIIEIGKALKKVEVKCKILLIGAGNKFDEINKLIRDNKLENEILQLGVRKDIPELYSTFDLFILPSKYEGLPLVMVEAQASGRRCIVSDVITKETDMGLGLIEYLPINQGVNSWVKAIISSKEEPEKICSIEEIKKMISNRGYSSKQNADIINSIYLS
ncbi:MAG: glycosyltransferase family 1 protein [Bacillota bacterium]|nr:glycosyltransferase family 1 protein [Bacillota bacterium]